MNARIEVPMDRIAGFCRQNRIRRLSLFGSVLRDDFSADSDVDVLLEFEPGACVEQRSGTPRRRVYCQGIKSPFSG